ncbi:MAG: TIGR01777 family oxidoreductase, partial [Ferruginibacter sp.]
METILITGGTGLIGKALTKVLITKGYSVIILSRSALNLNNTKEENNIRYAHWDIKKKQIDIKALQVADYIIHLAGAGVMDKKWTAEYKKEISSSRADSASLIVESLKENTNKVKAVISASAIGWYPATDNIHFEEETADESFLGQTTQLWEESINPVTQIDKRLVTLRIGIVLSKEGGALKEFMNPLKFGIAAILGNGKQMISWIHINDLCRIFLFAIENKNLNGVYNAIAPNPVDNKTLTNTLAKKLNGRYYFPIHIPEFILKILLGGRSIEI